MIPNVTRQTPALPTLVGRLITGREGLEVVAFCAGGCRRSHTLTWGVSSDLDHIEEVDAPCFDLASPYRGGRLAVRLDPKHSGRHRRLLADRRGRQGRPARTGGRS